MISPYLVSNEESYLRDVIDLFDLPQKLELNLLEGLTHYRKDVRKYLLVTLANLTIKPLSSYQLLVLSELVLHLLSLQEVDVLLEEKTYLLQYLVHP